MYRTSPFFSRAEVYCDFFNPRSATMLILYFNLYKWRRHGWGGTKKIWDSIQECKFERIMQDLNTGNYILNKWHQTYSKTTMEDVKRKFLVWKGQRERVHQGSLQRLYWIVTSRTSRCCKYAFCRSWQLKSVKIQKPSIQLFKDPTTLYPT
jgi:hypothetical protein